MDLLRLDAFMALRPDAWQRIQAGTFRWEINRRRAREPWISSLSDPERWIHAAAVPLRAEAPGRARLVRMPAPGQPGLFWIVKRYCLDSGWSRAKETFRPSRALRAFRRAFTLQAGGLQTAEPVAAGEDRWCGWLRAAYLITEEVQGARALRELWTDRRPPRHARCLARKLGVTLARLHNLNFRHRDPSLSNFLVQHAGTGADQIVLIDWESIRPVPVLSRGMALRDLRQLLWRIPVSPRERLWFMASYSRCRGTVRSREWLAQLDAARPPGA